MTTRHETPPRRRTRASAVAMLAISGAIIAAALGGGALRYPAISSAEPEWDVGYYDECMKIINDVVKCCIWSGGVLRHDKNLVPHCYAPPAAQPQESDPTGPPPAVADPGGRPPVAGDPRTPPQSASNPPVIFIP